VAYDSFDYSNSESMMITLTVRYDNATQDQDIMPKNVRASGSGPQAG
jgi:hypothetical protein